MRLLPAALALCCLAGAASAREVAPRAHALATHAERTGFVETGRYAEVERLCADFAARYPQAVRCESFGRTPEGREMRVLVASTSGVLDAARARRRGLQAVLVQGGIHAGEIDGKDAGFLALREILEGDRAGGVLDAQVLLFVPVFNVDGHEYFREWNRPNQRGPAETGFRGTARNYNLNRDYVKADAPEMRAMLALVDAWDPILVADLHVTNGARFEHDVAVQIEPLDAGDAGMAAAGKALRDELLDRHARRGGLPLPYYPTLLRHDDPTSGFAANIYPPRFSTGYFPARNRFAVLVETHSWKPYAQRVQTTHDLLVDLLTASARDGGRWRALADAADAAASGLGGTRFALSWKHGGAPTMIDFRGYAYRRVPSDVSGTTWTRYDEGAPEIWHVPLYEQLFPEVEADLPRAGYIVGASHAGVVAPLLDLHGIAYRRLPAARTLMLDTWRIPEPELAATSFEGRQRVEVSGQWRAETRGVAAGSLFVPIAQPKARLVATLFEPAGPDSLLAWGQFNTIFERKEYVGAYVAEEIARDMLEDPAIRAEFERTLAEDPAFAGSPARRLDFFARRHPSWDERYGLVPVFRTQSVPD